MAKKKKQQHKKRTTGRNWCPSCQSTYAATCAERCPLCGRLVCDICFGIDYDACDDCIREALMDLRNKKHRT